MIATFSNARISRFGKGGAVLRSRSADPLAEAQIRDAVPSIFAEDKHASRSDRYTYIPTADVLRALSREGFEPYEVRQGGSRDEGKVAYTKHLVRLRYRGTTLAVGDTIRELVLLNSHDGTSSYQLMSGLFRMVCSNGLIVCEEAGEMQRIPHKGDVVDQVVEGAYRIIGDGERLAEDVAEMRSIELTEDERGIFSRAALQVRYPDRVEDGVAVAAAPITPAAADQARRPEDRRSDLWATFNRVQENLVEGGQRYTHRADDGSTSRRQTRPVRGVDGNVALNRALWTLAEEMRRLKQA